VCSPSLASRARLTQTSLGVPWKRPPPRKPPCAHGPYVVAPPCGCGLSAHLSGGGPGNCSGSLWQKRGARTLQLLALFLDQGRSRSVAPARSILRPPTRYKGRSVRPRHCMKREPESNCPGSALRLTSTLLEHGEERSLGNLLFEELYSFVGEGWEQEDDITLRTLRHSSVLS
jgi:hypothetical protein